MAVRKKLTVFNPKKTRASHEEIEVSTQKGIERYGNALKKLASHLKPNA